MAIHVVVGHGSDAIKKYFTNSVDLLWVNQAEQTGTADAVKQTLPSLNLASDVLVLYGDVPLTPADVMVGMLEQVTADSMSLLTVELADPQGYGRIVRTDNKITAIVEHKDASEAEIIAFTRQRLAGFKCPKAVVFQELPKTSTGKIQKFELRKQAKAI